MKRRRGAPRRIPPSPAQVAAALRLGARDEQARERVEQFIESGEEKQEAASDASGLHRGLSMGQRAQDNDWPGQARAAQLFAESLTKEGRKDGA